MSAISFIEELQALLIRAGYSNIHVDGDMPALENVTNGAIIDLNPAFAIEFGIAPARMNNSTLSPVTWGWVD